MNAETSVIHATHSAGTVWGECDEKVVKTHRSQRMKSQMHTGHMNCVNGNVWIHGMTTKHTDQTHVHPYVTSWITVTHIQLHHHIVEASLSNTTTFEEACQATAPGPRPSTPSPSNSLPSVRLILMTPQHDHNRWGFVLHQTPGPSPTTNDPKPPAPTPATPSANPKAPTCSLMWLHEFCSCTWLLTHCADVHQVRAHMPIKDVHTSMPPPPKPTAYLNSRCHTCHPCFFHSA